MEPYGTFCAPQTATWLHVAMAAAQFCAALNTIDAERRAQSSHPELLHPAAAKVLATLDREWDGLARHREFGRGHQPWPGVAGGVTGRGALAAEGPVSG